MTGMLSKLITLGICETHSNYDFLMKLSIAVG